MSDESSNIEFSAIDELFGTLLERFGQNYPVKLRRDAKILEIDITGLNITAMETGDVDIIVECNFSDEEGTHTMSGGVVDCADAIEEVLSKYVVLTFDENRSQKRKWWQFWKSR